jgi:flavin-dependent dehydrogenase
MGSPEALIVGAGPAGSIAALVLARAGVRVRLIDRARFPRDKLCGDTLNPGALAMLDRLGIGPRVRERALPVEGMIVTGPRGTTVSAAYPDGLRGAAVRRADLDLLLIAEATAAGACFEPGIAVRAPLMEGDDRAVHGVHATSGGVEMDLRARVVIAADGRASRLASALGLSRFASSPRRWAFGACFHGVTGQTARGEMHIRRDGYIGVAPLPCGLTNVCVVREFGPARDGPAEAGHDDQKAGSAFRRTGENIATTVAADPLLRDRFATARQVSPVTTLGPLAIDSRAPGCPGLLLAGDAAGFIDPMTGDGLRFALRGGMLAAEAALRELETSQPAWQWLAARRADEFSGKWRINRVLRRLVGSPAGVDLAARLATRWDAPVRYLIGVAGDVSIARHVNSQLPTPLV